MLVGSLPLRGAGGERIDFARTIHSHGVATLPPVSIDSARTQYRTVLRLEGRPSAIQVDARGETMRIGCDRRLSSGEKAHALRSMRRMFRLDEDLSPFYQRIEGDARVAWACSGGGRLLASPSVFEEVVKTICTTNCAWSGTIRMVTALVNDLGGGAFPTPGIMANANDSWYRDVARAGYRGAYLRALARDVASGNRDLEALLPVSGMSDDRCERELLSLPGVGPYAAAHVMLLLGRYHRLILDSWTRPTYLRVAKKKRVKDATVVRAFSGFGTYAGLAFWLYLTRDWHDVPG